MSLFWGDFSVSGCWYAAASAHPDPPFMARRGPGIAELEALEDTLHIGKAMSKPDARAPHNQVLGGSRLCENGGVLRRRQMRFSNARSTADRASTLWACLFYPH